MGIETSTNYSILRGHITSALQGNTIDQPYPPKTSPCLEEFTDLTLTSVIKSPINLIQSGRLCLKAWCEQDMETFYHALFKFISFPLVFSYFIVAVTAGSILRFFTDTLPTVPSILGVTLLGTQQLFEVFQVKKQLDFIKKLKAGAKIKVLKNLNTQYNQLSSKQIEKIKGLYGYETLETIWGQIKLQHATNQRQLAYRVRPWAASLFFQHIDDALKQSEQGNHKTAEALYALISSQAKKKRNVHIVTAVVAAVVTVTTALAFFVFPHALVGAMLFWIFTSILSLHSPYFYGQLDAYDNHFSMKKALYSLLPSFATPQLPPHALRV